MKKAILSLGLFVMLGGCPGPTPMTNNSATPLPLPTGTPGAPGPTQWLSPDPVCTGTLTRAEWLVCDNKGLNDLHHQLAYQWQAARQSATPEREQVLEDQLYALLSERDLCQDIACISAAYRRYLTAPPPIVKPTPAPSKWKPKPKPKPKPGKWRPRPHRGDWDDGPQKGQSCLAAMGVGPAQRLSQQCDAVNSGPGGSCSPRRSCEDLREQIVHGCRQSYRKPGFCRL
jgi:hypothetical protein